MFPEKNFGDFLNLLCIILYIAKYFDEKREKLQKIAIITSNPDP
jgi:hypothetical protein